MGIAMSVYIASLSVISLAISLGSRDMVEDILAGLLMLFERQIKVGDIVEIDGCRGQVQEIGIRSTKLLCDGNDVRFLSNSGIRSIVNKSMRVSILTLSVSMVTDQSLEYVEDLMRKNLPEIQKKENRILGDLTLDGISSVTGGGKSGIRTVGVRFSCRCQERDQKAIQDNISRQIFFLCERENIELR